MVLPIASVYYGVLKLKTLSSRLPLQLTRSFRQFTKFGSCRREVDLQWKYLRRNKSHRSEDAKLRNKSTLLYVLSGVILVAGLSYAAVPLYRLYCQSTGYGGETVVGHDETKVATMKKNVKRLIRVRFNADTASSLMWNFKPQQSEIKLYPGETALAFYTAMNPTDVPITGISTYNVIPFEAGPYFNKIQCFCFEEQRLNPHELVDMPVFFYIDPEITEDPKTERLDEITLSYTFFEAKVGLKLPIPQFAR